MTEKKKLEESRSFPRKSEKSISGNPKPSISIGNNNSGNPKDGISKGGPFKSKPEKK